MGNQVRARPQGAQCLMQLLKSLIPPRLSLQESRSFLRYRFTRALRGWTLEGGELLKRLNGKRGGEYGTRLE